MVLFVSGLQEVNSMTKFYLIERKYIGPNPYHDENIDRHQFEIRTEPGKELLDASYGQVLEASINNELIRFHGEFDDLKAAIVAARSMFGDFRTHTHEQEGGVGYVDLIEASQDIQLIMRVGKHYPLTVDGTAEFVGKSLESLSGEKELELLNYSDEDIGRFVDNLQAQANKEGYALIEHVAVEAIEIRQEELMAEQEEEVYTRGRAFSASKP